MFMIFCEKYASRQKIQTSIPLQHFPPLVVSRKNIFPLLKQTTSESVKRQNRKCKIKKLSISCSNFFIQCTKPSTSKESGRVSRKKSESSRSQFDTRWKINEQIIP